MNLQVQELLGFGSLWGVLGGFGFGESGIWGLGARTSRVPPCFRRFSVQLYTPLRTRIKIMSLIFSFCF